MDHKERGHGGPHPSRRHQAELVIREPEDLLGYIPHAMGEWPSESLVAVTVGSGTVGVTVRVDLPSASGEDSEAYAESVCAYLATDPLADGAVLVVYTAQPWTEMADPPRHGLVTELQGALAKAGLPVLDAWLVGERHWRSVMCRRSSCCPWPGERLERITASRLGTELVYRGSTFEVPASSGPLRVAGPRAGAHPRGLSGEPPLTDHSGVHSRSWWGPGEFAAALAAWDDTLRDSRAPGPERLGLLAASLSRPALRDAVIVAAALDGRAAWVGTVVLGGLDRGEKYDGGLPGASMAAGGAGTLSSGGADGADLVGGGVDAAGLVGGGVDAAGLVGGGVDAAGLVGGGVDAAGLVGGGVDAAGLVGGGAGDSALKSPVRGGLELLGELPELPGGLSASEVSRIVAAWAGRSEDDGEPRGADRAGAGPSGADLEEGAALAFGGVLLGSTPEAPSWERIERLERVLRTMTAMEAPEVRAPALAVLGWIHWVRGRGAKAVGFLRRALSASPDYRFAELFLRVIESGELAAWARRPETAWRRLSDVA